MWLLTYIFGTYSTCHMRFDINREILDWIAAVVLDNIYGNICWGPRAIMRQLQYIISRACWQCHHWRCYLDKTDFGNCENCSNSIVSSVRVWIAGYCAKIVGCASSFTGLGGGLFEYSNKCLCFFFSMWYVNITNCKPIIRERTAYNNEYPVGGAERKDSFAIGRPLVHIRWLSVVDQLGAEQIIWRKWKLFKNNKKVKVVAPLFLFEAAKELCRMRWTWRNSRTGLLKWSGWLEFQIISSK